MPLKKSILALGVLLAALLCLTACGNSEVRTIPEGQVVFALPVSSALFSEVHTGDIVGLYDGGTAIAQLRYVRVYAVTEDTLLLLLRDSQVRALGGASNAAVALISCGDARRAEELLALQAQLNGQNAAPRTEPTVPITEPTTQPITEPVTEPVTEPTVPVTEPVVPTTKPVVTDDPTEPAKPTLPSKPAEPKPTVPTVPIEPEPTEPVTEPTEPSKPTEPKPTEPKPTEPKPTDPMEPAKPTKPTMPTEPAKPIFPIRPVPVIPIQPPAKPTI